MYNYFFLAIVLACLGLLGYIVFSKFTQLANLDLENLPEEKVYRKKQEIISKRIEESNKKLKEKLGDKAAPLKKLWGILQLKFRVYVGKVERLLHHEQNIKIKEANKGLSKEEKAQKVSALVLEGRNFLQSGQLEEAEAGFISAIKINSKAVEVYNGLADVYLQKGAVEEAKETFLFILQLNSKDDSVMVKLGDIFEIQNNLEQAIEYYQKAILINDSFAARFAHLSELLTKIEQHEVAKEAIVQAVELEPQNPKYLDLMIETAIICKDKTLAEEGFASLRLVNPENQKLESFKDRIGKL